MVFAKDYEVKKHMVRRAACSETGDSSQTLCAIRIFTVFPNSVMLRASASHSRLLERPKRRSWELRPSIFSKNAKAILLKSIWHCQYNLSHQYINSTIILFNFYSYFIPICWNQENIFIQIWNNWNNKFIFNWYISVQDFFWR